MRPVSPGRMGHCQFVVGGLGVAGAATDARKTSGAAGHATRTGELAAGAATDARDAARPTGTATGATIYATGAAGAVGAAAATRVLLVDNVSGRATRRATDVGLSCRHGHHSYRSSNSPTNNKRFHEIEFCQHATPHTPVYTGPKHSFPDLLIK
jgi:hypothetical protein